MMPQPATRSNRQGCDTLRLLPSILGGSSACPSITALSINPHGNLTGGSIFFSILGPKHVELLHELIPAVNTIAALGNPGNENFQLGAADIRAAADALGDPQDLELADDVAKGDGAVSGHDYHIGIFYG
jgi:hypothetical protein